MKKRWLAEVSWPVVVETNRLLCVPKAAFHGPTSDGFDTAKKLWEVRYQCEMPLVDAVELCRKCHRLAPFCNFNGNTFVAVIRKVIAEVGMPADLAAAFRSLAGHIVAGIATPEEQKQFLKLIESSFPEHHA